MKNRKQKRVAMLATLVLIAIQLQFNSNDYFLKPLLTVF